jgi:competence protein ComEC
MSSSRPAFRFVLLFAAGILLSEWLSLPSLLLLFFLIVFIILSAIIFRLGKKQYVAVILLYWSIILTGSLLHSLQKLNPYFQKLEPISQDDSLTLFGTIENDPIRRDKKINCIVRTDSIFRLQRIDKEPRRVMVVFRLTKGETYHEEIKCGRKIRLSGLLEPFPFQRNPGEFDYGKYLALNDIQGVISVRGLRRVNVKEYPDENIFRTWLYSAQHSLYQIIDSLHSPRQAGFLKGIIFGYRGDIPSDVKQAFTDTGTIHILAVSGSNVAFVAFIFFSLFGLFRISRRAITGAAILGLIVYMLLTGSSPSVVRATIMIIVILCGTLFERKTDIYNSISFAAIILLLWNTNTLFDIGFQLSFSAVISIVYFYPRLVSLYRFVPDKITKIKIIDAGLKLLALSFSAQLGTIPFIVYYFNRISVISVIANLPVVPVSGINTFIGAVEIMIYPISSFIAKFYAAANDSLVWLLLEFVKHAASVPFATIEIWHFPAVFIIGYFIAFFSVFNLDFAQLRIWMLIFVLILGNYFLFERVWIDLNPKLIATVIDIGQGDAALLEFPNGKRMLVDAGPSSQQFDAGERTIVPFLKHKGIKKLDYLIITHPHSDHIGGAGSILKSIKVDTLAMASINTENRLLRETLEIAREKNVGIKTIFAGNKIPIDSNARVYILYPRQDQCSGKSANNSSVVMKIYYGKSSMLLTGDTENTDEKSIICRYAEFLSNDILKVGHHGSRTSTSGEFLNIVRPGKAIISVGNRNQFHDPSPFTLKRLMSHMVEIERTDRSGAIILENDGNRWIRKEWR